MASSMLAGGGVSHCGSHQLSTTAPADHVGHGLPHILPGLVDVLCVGGSAESEAEAVQRA